MIFTEQIRISIKANKPRVFVEKDSMTSAPRRAIAMQSRKTVEYHSDCRKAI